MATLNLDIVSPSIRYDMLNRQILGGYRRWQFPVLSEYIISNDPAKFYRNLHYPPYKEEGKWHNDIIHVTDNKDVENSTDGYTGNVRRNYYSKQWDKRKDSYEDAADHIYKNIEDPDKKLQKLWDDKIRNKYTSYIDYTNYIFGKNTKGGILNALAGIVTGDGVGISLEGGGISVVSDFDIKQSLGGRIFSTITGQDTPLGKFGMKAAAVAMSQKAIRNSSKIVSGAINEGVQWLLGKVGIAKDEDGFNMSKYLESKSITNKPGMTDDVLETTGLKGILNAVTGSLGVGNIFGNDVTQNATSNRPNYIEIPNYIIDFTDGKWNDSTNYNKLPNFYKYVMPVVQATVTIHKQIAGEDTATKKDDKYKDVKVAVSLQEYRRLQNQQLITWTGNLTAQQIYENLSRNIYSAGYEIKGKKLNNDYVSTWEFNTEINNGDITIKTSDTNNIDIYGRTRNFVDTWGDNIGDNAFKLKDDNNRNNSLQGYTSYSYANSGDIYGVYTSMRENSGTLLANTRYLFSYNKAKTIISSFGRFEEESTFTQTGVAYNANGKTMGISRGRPLLQKKVYETGDMLYGYITEGGYIDPWCRTFTWEKQYRTALNTLRPFTNSDDDYNSNKDEGNYGKFQPLKKLHDKLNEVHIRPLNEVFLTNTTLQANGMPKIAPHKLDFITKEGAWKGKKEDRWKYNKRYMFSIENLAWKDLPLEDILCPSQIGPNGGRIMWFAPLNLSFDETVNVTLNNETFIGRGEDVYTYSNTQRSGTLKFAMVVDHSSYHEFMKARKFDDPAKDYQAILRWDAGCDQPILEEIFKTTPPDIPEKPKIPPPEIKTVPEPEEKILVVRVYYPNDYSGRDEPYSVYNGEDDYQFGKNSSRGTAAMAYIYKGGPEGYGYEMDLVDGASLSGVKGGQISGLNPDSITTVYDGITCDTSNERIKNRQGVNYKGKDWMLYGAMYNMHKTDIMYRGDGSRGVDYVSSLKNIPPVPYKPEERRNYLPRGRYNKLTSFWDVANKKQLNATKPEGGELSFADFYDYALQTNLRTDKDGNPIPNKHKDEKWDYDKLKELLTNDEVKEIIFSGNASAAGTTDDNGKLALGRAETLKQFVLEKFGIQDDPNKIKVITDNVTGVGMRSSKCASDGESKQGRFAQMIVKRQKTKTVTLNQGEIDAAKKAQEEWEEESKNIKEGKIKNNVGRYDEEMEFYKYVDENIDLTFSNIKDRYSHYIPATWGLTPEGFNARLTHLHQCTRQGPTISAMDSDITINNANNLSFGRPPVCILRIGDFITSRIYIESISFQWQQGSGITWDLNPEGIGVSPRYAEISLNFKYMGGQDLSGPISRLQNAITFNYYANTSVYDDRADSNIFLHKEKMNIIENNKVEKIESSQEKLQSRRNLKKTDKSQSGGMGNNLFNPLNYKNGLDYTGYISGNSDDNQYYTDEYGQIQLKNTPPATSSEEGKMVVSPLNTPSIAVAPPNANNVQFRQLPSKKPKSGDEVQTCITQEEQTIPISPEPTFDALKKVGRNFCNENPTKCKTIYNCLEWETVAKKK